jgi:hypothetical protein
MKKTILALSIMALSSTVMASDPWDQDLQDLHDKLNIDDGNNVLMLFDVISATRSQLQWERDNLHNQVSQRVDGHDQDISFIIGRVQNHANGLYSNTNAIDVLRVDTDKNTSDIINLDIAAYNSRVYDRYLDGEVQRIEYELNSEIQRVESEFNSAVQQVQSEFERQMNEQEKRFNAGTAASIAAANAIRTDNGLRAAVGYFNDEAALSLGGRHNSATFTLTIDTAENVGAGIGFNF